MNVLKFDDYVLINKKDDIKYDYGVAMLTYDASNWKDIIGEIDIKDLATGDNQRGIEETPHITLLYGFHSDVDMKEVAKIFENIPPINIKLVDVSCFENEKYDVVKFGVKSNELSILHEWLKHSFDYTSDFPDYNPHITIAYVKPGFGKKYCDELSDKYIKSPIENTLDEIVLSSASGEEIKIKLNPNS